MVTERGDDERAAHLAHQGGVVVGGSDETRPNEWDEPARAPAAPRRMRAPASGRTAPAFGDEWPPWMVFVGQSALIVALLLACVYGPPLYTCRQMKDEGRLFYGETVRSCVQERVAARNEAFNAFLARLMSRT